MIEPEGCMTNTRALGRIGWAVPGLVAASAVVSLTAAPARSVLRSEKNYWPPVLQTPFRMAALLPTSATSPLASASA